MSTSEQPTLIDGTSLTTLFPPGVQQWIRSIAPTSTTPTNIPPTEPAPPVEVMKPPTIGTEVERLLTLAGWTIQDYAHADIRSAQGVAIRDFPTRTGTTESIDYLLFVDQQATGVIFVMEEGQNRIGLEEATSLSSRTPMLRGEKPRRDPIPFTYETNVQGTLIRFTSYLDPVTRTRSVFAFHRPETFALWLQQAPPNVAKSRTDLLRARLRRMPSLSREGLWNEQYEAIANLEKSLAENRPRALIQMASGSGKTRMMVNSIYRLINLGNAQRILYLTDGDARAQYVYAEFRQGQLPEEGGTFSDFYHVQFLQQNEAISGTGVWISSIQSITPTLYKDQLMLKQCYAELDSLQEDWSAFGTISMARVTKAWLETKDLLAKGLNSDRLEQVSTLTNRQRNILRAVLSTEIEAKTMNLQSLQEYTDAIRSLLDYGINITMESLQYNPTLPIDAFDIVVVDEYDTGTIESSRSILEYFDAFLIGLTEAEDTRILGFFNNNVVYRQKLAEILSMSTNKNPQVDVCILCALAEEADNLKKAWKDSQHHVEFQRARSERLKRVYDYATLPNIDGTDLGVLVTWLPSYGPEETALQLRPMLEEFTPQFAAMTGICAGDKKKVTLGDIIVAKEAFLYDTGKVVIGEDGRQELQRDTQPWRPPIEVVHFVNGFNDWKDIVEQEPRPPSKLQQRDWLLSKLLEPKTQRVDDIPDAELAEHAPDLIKVLQELQSDPDAYITHDRSLKDPARVRNLRFQRIFPFQDPKHPGLYIAPIASGNAVRADNPFNAIRLPVRDTIAVEMEGATFYRTLAEFNNIHSLLVKGVSDYADSNKDDTYRNYASKVSALYMLSFIREYVISSRFPALQGRTPKPSSPTTGTSISTPPTTKEPQKGLQLFYSYDPADNLLRKELEKHLVTLKRQELIKQFYAHDIGVGYSQLLEQAQIILLLISPDFLASDDLYEEQLKPALKMQEEGKARIIPILLRRTDLEGTLLEKVVVIPRNHIPVAEWRSKDGVFAEITREIRAVITQINNTKA